MIKWKYEIGDRIVRKDDSGHVIIDCTITNREIRTRETDQRNFPYYEYQCNVCGASGLWKHGHSIDTKICDCCCNKIRIRGINTIGDQYPHCVPYFDGDDAFDPNLHPSHHYDLRCPTCGYVKNITIISLLRGGFYCDHCNSLGVKRPDLVKYLVHENDVNLPFSCGKYILVKCPDCGDEKYMKVNNLNNKGYRCLKCGDGRSFPEKILTCVLTQLNVDFVTQLSIKQSQWCGKYKYDFYIPNQSIIIETHGMQHYNEKSGFKSLGGRTLEEEQENDKNKAELAKRNGIKHYIVFDCRFSSLDWIKRTILSSQLNTFYDLSKIDWTECAEFASRGLVKQICDYWKQHDELTTGELAKIFNIGATTAREYLIRGTTSGWCCYDSSRERMKNEERRISSTRARLSKKVTVFKDNVCLGIFDSATELSKKSLDLYGVRLVRAHICAVCRGKLKHHKGFIFKYT
jgi:very-short-patch-repair endonuclease